MSLNMRHEAAWAAGFFDGEGSTCSNTTSLAASVGNTNLSQLERFARVVGAGTITGPKVLPGRKPIFTWRAYGIHAKSAIFSLWEFLGDEKRDQALDAMLKWSFRRVNNAQGFCLRGHNLSIVGRFTHGTKTECSLCKKKRRTGNLGPPVDVRAIDLRLGMREYAPQIET